MCSSLHAIILFCALMHLVSLACCAPPTDEAKGAPNEAPPTIPTKPKSELQKFVDSIRSSPFGTFDKDTRDDCADIIDACWSDIFANIFVECAATCTQQLEQPRMNGKASDASAFYDLPSVRLQRPTNSKSMQMEDLEGYVVIVAIVPLIPGMAAYYYELLEHLHSSFRPNLEIVLLPVDVGVEGGIHLVLHDPPHVRVLQEIDDATSNAMIRYLLDVKPTSGTASVLTRADGTTQHVQSNLNLDRVTMYLLSADGMFVERLTSPSMNALQERVTLFMKSMDYDEL